MTQPVLVSNEDAQYFTINYESNGDAARRSYLEALWKPLSRYDPAMGQTYKILCRPTNPNLEVTVDHLFPTGSSAGKYRIETFVPTKTDNSQKAIFSITYNVNTVSGTQNEEYTIVVVDLAEIQDTWYSLGEFDLDPKKGSVIGRVRQYDLSLEDPPLEASYGPVRWVPLFVDPSRKDRFDSPVGTIDERNRNFPSGNTMFGKYPIWDGKWFDANPFLTWYTYGFHTGADLNLPGSSDADKGKEIYAISNGVVTYAGRAGTWGNIIVISHPNAKVTTIDGKSNWQPVYSRYGHVDNKIMVSVGERVKRGQLIGYIGLAQNAVSGWHLHFDVCYTDLLKRRPAHWPNMDTIRALRFMNQERNPRAYQSAQAAVKKEVTNNYIDPLLFIKANH